LIGEINGELAGKSYSLVGMGSGLARTMESDARIEFDRIELLSKRANDASTRKANGDISPLRHAEIEDELSG
jgi:hypothetical protein